MKRYEFALLRYQHDLDAGEFANVGVVLFDVENRRLLTKISERYKRLSDFFGEFDGSAYRSMLRHVERALDRVEASLLQPNVFDQTTPSLESLLLEAMPAPDSCLLCSKSMSGVAASPEIRIAELFDEFVTRYEPRDEAGRRGDEDVRREVQRRLTRTPLHNALQWSYGIQAANYYYEFEAGWRNGKPQVFEPISFDLAKDRSIIDKANLWTGRLSNLSHGADFAFSAIVAPPQEPTLGRAFDRALALLRGSPLVREVVTEDRADTLFEIIRQDIEAHEQPHRE